MRKEDPLADKHIVAVKELRRSGDELIQRIRELPFGKSEQSREAVRKFQEGVMWLGMELKRMNDAGFGENPYPNSKDPSNTRIDPTADGLKL